MKYLFFLWALLLIAPAALADQPAVCAEYAMMLNCSEPATLLIHPDGSGPLLSQARTPDGRTVDATITIRLVTQDGTPIVYFPPEDVWLETETEGLFLCGTAFMADDISDATGIMTFSQAYAGGGQHQGLTFVYINGQRAISALDWPWPTPLPGLRLSFNSPDINGDGSVNLTDLGLLCSDFYGEYHFRSDFYRDGVLNLSDLGAFAQGLGKNCP